MTENTFTWQDVLPQCLYIVKDGFILKDLACTDIKKMTQNTRSWLEAINEELEIIVNKLVAKNYFTEVTLDNATLTLTLKLKQRKDLFEVIMVK